MPKLTAKYKAALEAAKLAGVQADTDQEALYSALNQAHYFWDTDKKTWEKVLKKPTPYGTAERPIWVCHLRLISHPTLHDEFLAKLRPIFETMGYELTGESKQYPRREDNGVSTYLEFRL